MKILICKTKFVKDKIRKYESGIKHVKVATENAFY